MDQAKLLLMKLLLLGLILSASASTKEHLFRPIDTCYQWLEKWQLEAKIAHAKTHNGELLFIGKDPLYCWRSPVGAQSAWEDHGDEIIRIKLRPNAKFGNRSRTDIEEMKKNNIDVIYSNDSPWHEYTIAPNAVESWSTEMPQTASELRADYQFILGANVTDDDVFYPYEKLDRQWLKSNIGPLIGTLEFNHNQGRGQVFGQNIDHHFKTIHQRPWELSVGNLNAFRNKVNEGNEKLKKIKPLRINKVTGGFEGDKPETIKSCDGEKYCYYQVNRKFLKRWSSYKLTYYCGENGPFTETITDHAFNKFISLNCNSLTADDLARMFEI